MDSFVSRVGNLGCSSGIITQVGNIWKKELDDVDMWQHIDFGCDREPQVWRELRVAAGDWIWQLRLMSILSLLACKFWKNKELRKRGVVGIPSHMTKPGMAAQSVSWSGEGPLTFEDVSKLFSLPIAEAAQQLSEQSNPIFYFLFVLSNRSESHHGLSVRFLGAWTLPQALNFFLVWLLDCLYFTILETWQFQYLSFGSQCEMWDF